VIKLLTITAVAVVTGFIAGGDAFAVPAVQRSAVVSHVGAAHGGRRQSWGHGTSVHAFNYQVESPRDASSGLPTGKRMHKPYTVAAHNGPGH
jgi:hypothetical protein